MSDTLAFFVWPIGAVMISVCVSWTLVKSWRCAPLDRPSDRSLHDRPVPRIGGVAVLSAIMVLASLAKLQVPMMLPIAAFLGLISFVDDYRSLPVFFRLAAHIVAAFLFVGFVFPTHEFWFLCVATVGMVWGINLFNFMDGSDGLATGMALIGFGAYGLAALRGGDRTLALLSFVVSGSAGGFLVFNWAPAKAFLGDAGSVPLGFLAGAVGVEGVRRGLWGWGFPLFVFCPFIADSTVTIVRRTFQGEIPWRAHRSHYYQRLIRMGWGHRMLAVRAYALMVVCAGVALCLPRSSRGVQSAVFLVGALSGVSVARCIDKRWNRFLKETGHAWN